MHSVIITAYKDIDALWHLVNALDRRFFDIHIHIDRKSAISKADESALQDSGCHVLRKYTIPWGGYSHLRAILELGQTALGKTEADYIHIISGQDHPIKSAAEIASACQGEIYMSVTTLDDLPPDVRSRYELRNVFYFMQNLGNAYRILDKVSRRIQEALGVKRGHIGNFDVIYKGMIWISMPAKVFRFVLEHPQARSFLKALRTVYLPEEIFFQTIIMNSSYRENVIASNRRHTDWVFRNGSRPAVLDATDVRRLENSDAFFVRKVDSKISAAVIAEAQRLIAEGIRRDEGKGA